MQQVTLFSLFNAGLFIVADKWGIEVRYDKYKPRKFPDWCQFCIFFWMGCIEQLFLYTSKICIFNSYFLISVFFFAICIGFFSNFITNLNDRIKI